MPRFGSNCWRIACVSVRSGPMGQRAANAAIVRARSFARLAPFGSGRPARRPRNAPPARRHSRLSWGKIDEIPIGFARISCAARAGLAAAGRDRSGTGAGGLSDRWPLCEFAGELRETARAIRQRSCGSDRPLPGWKLQFQPEPPRHVQPSWRSGGLALSAGARSGRALGSADGRASGAMAKKARRDERRAFPRSDAPVGWSVRIPFGRRRKLPGRLTIHPIRTE